MQSHLDQDPAPESAADAVSADPAEALEPEALAVSALEASVADLEASVADLEASVAGLTVAPEPQPGTEPEPVSEAVIAAPEPEPEDRMALVEESDAGGGPATEPEPETPVAVEPDPSAAAEAEPEAAITEDPETGAEPTAQPDPGPPAVPEPEPEPEPPAAEPRTVAELIAATLRGAGVRLAFTVPGESFLPVLDALEAAGIRVVATRHEGAAAFAAEAYGQLTGRPAVCLGTRIVGASNLAIGIHTATADSTPMFALVGQVDRRHRGREAFQESDLVGGIGSLAKWAGEIDDPLTAADMLESAVRAVLEGRPGPALISLSEDVLALPIPQGTQAPVVRPHPEAPSASDIRAVLHFLAAAERPVILAGSGVLRARCSNDLVRFAEILHVPVIASWRRGDVIPNDHPLYLGMTGFGSPEPVRARLAAADAVLVLGSRLSEPTSFGYTFPGPDQPWMHVDLEPRTEAVGDTPAPIRAVRADARAFLRGAVARLKDAVLIAEPLLARDRHNSLDREAWDASTVVDDAAWTGPGIHPGRVVADLRRLLPEDAILTTDAGAFGGWIARGFRFRRPGTFLGPTSGAMGYGVPAALAAALVHRERRVVAVVGDGGMGMTMAEMETAVREGAHIVVIVFDNERYGMIRDHQERQGSPTLPATDLGPVDFAAAARACGARGVRVDTDAAFEPALRTALAASGPTVIQLAMDRRWTSVDRPATDTAT